MHVACYISGNLRSLIFLEYALNKLQYVHCYIHYQYTKRQYLANFFIAFNFSTIQSYSLGWTLYKDVSYLVNCSMETINVKMAKEI